MIFPKQYAEYDLIYTITHILQGSLVCILPTIPGGLLAIYGLNYQLFQYALDIRVYIPKKKILMGHTHKHLINKLSEYLLGFIVTRGVGAGWTYLENKLVF
tara:strand:- start:1625 stop:1927 length:303 start_codon:yes stop_codon:yes gene_type:complete